MDRRESAPAAKSNAELTSTKSLPTKGWSWRSRAYLFSFEPVREHAGDDASAG